MLKEQAKQHLQEILGQAVPGRFSNYGSSSSSSYGSSTVDTRQLRARLENAIRVMQTGLVERDTEVGLPCGTCSSKNNLICCLNECTAAASSSQLASAGIASHVSF
jgi:hypothetical protein